MTFGPAVSSVFRNYARFNGVASRSEYWWWALFTTVISLVAGTLDIAINGQQNIGLLQSLWALGVIVPSLAVGVRRLRDAGYAWGFLLLALIPFVGAIVVIVLLCQPSKVRLQAPATPTFL